MHVEERGERGEVVEPQLAPRDEARHPSNDRRASELRHEPPSERAEEADRDVRLVNVLVGIAEIVERDVALRIVVGEELRERQIQERLAPPDLFQEDETERERAAREEEGVREVAGTFAVDGDPEGHHGSGQEGGRLDELEEGVFPGQVVVVQPGQEHLRGEGRRKEDHREERDKPHLGHRIGHLEGRVGRLGESGSPSWSSTG